MKSSQVLLAAVADGAALRALLDGALGARARVAKRREIWRWDDVQVHLEENLLAGSYGEMAAAGER